MLPPGGLGAHFRRDVRVLIREQDSLKKRATAFTGDLGLVWLMPWDGDTQLAPTELHPLYIEVCRRVRLATKDGALYARTIGSKKGRISAKELHGNTGDPWVPIKMDDAKALSIPRAGFSYRLMTKLLLAIDWEPSLLQKVQEDDSSEDLAVIARSLARGQGKTEGYHERIVPISKQVVEVFFRRSVDPLAEIATERVDAVGTLRGKVLRPALFVLFQGGAEQVNFRDNDTSKRVDPHLRRFEYRVDSEFFEALWKEAEVEQSERLDIRLVYLKRLSDRASDIVNEAVHATSVASMRRYKALVRAQSMFRGSLYKHFPDLRPRKSQTDVA